MEVEEEEEEGLFKAVAVNEEDPEREEELYWDLILFEGPIQNLVQQLTEVERWESSTKFCTAVLNFVL